MFALERDGLCQVVLCPKVTMTDQQPYHTGSVAARVNKDSAFRRTPGRRCEACYWCIIEESWKRQHHHWHMEHKDTKCCGETPGINTRNLQVQIEILGLREMKCPAAECRRSDTEEGHTCC